MDKVRHCVQQDTLGHRGRKGDPLYGIGSALRAAVEKLTDRQWARPERAIDVRAERDAVWVAWSVAQRLRLAHRHPEPAKGKKIAEQLIASPPTCPIPEVPASAER